MNDEPNTVFLRLEGALQAWGGNSKFVIRRTMEAPTKSGVMGVIACVMGISRQASKEWLSRFGELVMGVRIDRQGTFWWDFQTVGAKHGLQTAKRVIKKTAATGVIETLLTRREYLSDASFIVALQGETNLIKVVEAALKDPKWTPYLGRKCCPPTIPIFAGSATCNSMSEALQHHPWQPRFRWGGIQSTISLTCLLEWRASEEEQVAFEEMEVWYDSPVLLDPPVHEPRLVHRIQLKVNVGEPLQKSLPAPKRARANYSDSRFRAARENRLETDQRLCVFCKSPATTVHHVTYRRAGGNECQKDLHSLCRLCHDAVTMIEYGLGMGMDRIDPSDPIWRKLIIEKRDQIVNFRSLETRRRRLQPEEVE